MSATDIAEELIAAYGSGVLLAPVRGKINGVAAAYAVQQASVAIWQKQGRQIAGQKIGLTAQAVQEQLGVSEPDFGTLFADMILRDGAEIAAGAVLQPRIEAEIAFVLKDDVSGQSITPEQIVAATEYVCPALEICGSRIANWDIRIEDTIADNASAGLVVLGQKRTKPTLQGLADAAMSLRRNGDHAGDGRGAACLGNPAIAVAWLAQALTGFGGGLRAGDVVMSGALSKMVAAQPGDSFDADFGAMGAVAVRFHR